MIVLLDMHIVTINNLTIGLTLVAQCGELTLSSQV